MINPNYIAAKALLNLLSDEEKIKLCKEILDAPNCKEAAKKRELNTTKNGWRINRKLARQNEIHFCFLYILGVLYLGYINKKAPKKGAISDRRRIRTLTVGAEIRSSIH